MNKAMRWGMVSIGMAAIAFSLTGCGAKAEKEISQEIPQDGICGFTTEEEAKLCKDGRLAWFKPTRWGNEQLPMLVVAAYCDLNHPVVMNNSGVICVFVSKRLTVNEPKPESK